jgi:prepilin-type N-terminal cleavage/methylation domain-containing protein
MKNFRKMCRGQKGFTLIELLVVIIILGVLAAVVTLAVTRFIGKGAKESANAEAVTVQAAVEACLGDAAASAFTNVGAIAWDGSVGTSPVVTNSNGTFLASDYMRTHTFKATYYISPGGDITGALDTGWASPVLTFDNATQKWS